jgi:tetratricopeptide (TPR) repeat protein/predicted Ser/Thr protein kinase
MHPPDHTTSLENALIFATVRARMFGGGGQPAPVRIGPYRLLRRVGAGGMGEVFLAHDDSLDRPLAIKLLHARLGAERRFAERMQREAKALAKLNHPNVVHVYEVGEHEGRVYLAMEYVAGQSLGAWIHAHRPSWRAVLDAYLAAGEGLAAAHAVGLVHRDFKPENVLRGDDGRVCVADFGLARVGPGPAETGESRSGEAPSTLDERLSATGTVMGTLGYMPLEQLRGGVVDARSDQFSFALSLYLGLWQRPPFVAATPSERELALAAEPIRPPTSEVPRWVWPIVKRALAAEPDGRWPDLLHMLDALRHTPARVRARRRGAALLLATPLVVALGWTQLASQPDGDVCAIDEGLLAGSWDAQREQLVRERFAATGSPLAGEASTRVATALSQWTSRWLAAQRESCEATRVQGVQSDALLDRRTRCFEAQRRELDTLVTLLEHADAATLAHTGALLDTLPAPDECSAAALEADAELPLGPEALAAVDLGYQTLAAARHALALGHVARARELAARARSEGEAHGYVPLALEGRALQARLHIDGGALELGLDELRVLVVAAEQADQHDLAAGFRVTLARAAAGDASDLRLERWLVDEAELALDRVGRVEDRRRITLAVARARVAEHGDAPDEAEAAYRQAFALAQVEHDEALLTGLHIDHAGLLRRQGRLEPARQALEQAAAQLRERLGARAPELGRVEFDLGVITTELGDLDAAAGHFARALAIDEAAWGRDSLELARDRYGMHGLAFARGELEAGCKLVDEALPIYEARLGGEHEETGDVLNAAAICRFFVDDFEGAIVLYERALAIQRAQLGDRHSLVGHTHANLGQARLALGRLDAAEADFELALDILSPALGPDHPELALALLGRAQVWQARGDDVRALPELERVLAWGDDALQGSDLAELRFALARARVVVHGERELPGARELAELALVTFEAAELERLAAPVRAWLARWAP